MDGRTVLPAGRLSSLLLFLALLIGGQPVQAGLILPLVPGEEVFFGDFIVFSLPGLEAQTGNTGQFVVQSTPGQIQDGVVILTGASGNPVNQNFSGMDDAYSTPSGTTTFFGTSTTADPGSVGSAPVLDSADAWDADVAALRSFLTANNGMFAVLFNLNETGDADSLAGIDLLAWASVTLIDAGGILPTRTFIFSAADNPLTPADEHAAGLADSIAFGGPNPDPTSVGYDTADPRWAVVHGRITVDADGNFLHFGSVLPTDPPGSQTINQNLGADQAAFVVFNQELNDFILDPSSGYESLRIDARLSQINNGYEQAFLLADTQVHVIPEPASVALFSVGALAVGGMGWRRRRKSS